MMSAAPLITIQPYLTLAALIAALVLIHKEIRALLDTTARIRHRRASTVALALILLWAAVLVGEYALIHSAITRAQRGGRTASTAAHCAAPPWLSAVSKTFIRGGASDVH